MPIKPLNEFLPEEIDLTDRGLTVCSLCNIQVDYQDYPDGPRIHTWSEGSTTTYRARWVHLRPTECSDIRPQTRENRELFAWLKDLELKYLDEEVKKELWPLEI